VGNGFWVWFWRVVRAVGYTLLCAILFGMGFWLLANARGIPDADAKSFAIGIASNVACTGLIFWIVFIWQMDKTGEILQKNAEEQTQLREETKAIHAELEALRTSAQQPVTLAQNGVKSSYIRLIPVVGAVAGVALMLWTFLRTTTKQNL
jgi:type VI protein secretion system component VasK